MLTASRVVCTLSAFNWSTQMWVPIPLRNAQNQVVQRLSPTSQNINTSRTQRLSLVSWNIDAFSSQPVSRAKLILSHILKDPKTPDIIFLQEVTSEVRTSLLDNARVHSAFLVTDAEDQTSFEGMPFATMTLLSNAHFASDLDLRKEDDGIEGEGGGKFMFRCVSRVTLPSKYGRDGLYMDIISSTAPGILFCLVNVHLDSLGDTLPYCAQQIKMLADVLHEPGCSSGIIAGDFNAISPEDERLVDENDLVDAWVALHGRAGPGGATWGVSVERQDGLGPGRLDKVAILGLKVEEMEVLCPGRIEVPRPSEESIEIPRSDHYGLRCTLTI